MSIKEKYTEQEWTSISCLPNTIGFAMSKISKNNIFGSGSEMMASTKTIIDAHEKHEHNNLIQAILPNAEDMSLLRQYSGEQVSFTKQLTEDNNIKTPEEFSSIVLIKLAETIDVLKAKEPQDVIEDYKKFILEIALNVANASKEGSFLGFGGERFSKNERHFYNKLKNTLNN